MSHIVGYSNKERTDPLLDYGYSHKERTTFYENSASLIKKRQSLIRLYIERHTHTEEYSPIT